MGKYKKEIIAVIVQLCIFWLIPLLMMKLGPIFMVFLMLWLSFVVSLCLCTASANRIKYLFPFAAAVMFLPTVQVYYNSSALIHSLWYLAVSCAGFAVGAVIRALGRFIKKRF